MNTSSFTTEPQQPNKDSVLECKIDIVKLELRKLQREHYCCDLKCFRAPRSQVDGISCRRCGAFNYCICNCESFKNIINDYDLNDEVNSFLFADRINPFKKAYIQSNLKELNRSEFQKKRDFKKSYAEREYDRSQDFKTIPLNIKENRRYIKNLILNSLRQHNVRADIQIGNGLFESLKGYANADILTNAALGSVPYIGAPLLASRVIDETKTRMNGTMNKVDTLLDKVTQLFSSLTQYVPDVSLFASLRSLLVSLLNVYLASRENRVKSLILNLTNFVLSCDLDFKIFSPLFSVPEGNLIDLDTEVVRGSIQGPAFYEKTIAGTIIVILYSLSYKITGTMFNVDKAQTYLGKIGREFTGIRQLGTHLNDLTDKVIAWFNGEIGGEMATLCDIVPDLRRWFEEVQSFIERNEITKESVSDRILHDEDALRQVEDLYKRSLQFSMTLAELKIQASQRFAFDQHARIITELFKHSETSGAFGAKPRISPLVVWLRGESGTGKSGATFPLAIDLNNVLLEGCPREEKRNYSKNIYFRNVEQEFFDGYTNQNIVIYDDFGQIKDSTTKANMEFMELIRSKNTAAWPLHMASLQEKNKTKFTSKAIILTSNELNFNIQSITHTDAFYRRIDLCYEVMILPEFQKKEYSSECGKDVARLDTEKVYKKFGQPISLKVYGFRKIDLLTRNQVGDLLNYEQFKEECCTKLRAQVMHSRDLNKYLEDYACGEHGDKDIPYIDLKSKTDDGMMLYVEKNMIKKMPYTDVQIENEVIRAGIHSGEEEFYDALDWPEEFEEVDWNTAWWQSAEAWDEIEFDPRNRTEPLKPRKPMKIFIFSKTHDFQDISFEMNRIFEFPSHGKFVEYMKNKYGKIYFKCNQLCKNLKKSAESFWDWVSLVKSQTEHYIKEHPVRTVIIGVSVILGGFSLLGGWNWIFEDEDEIEIEHTANTCAIEANHSGDVVTKRRNRVKIESNVSGDITTKKKQKIKIEGNPSGDVTTTRKKNLRIEGDLTEAEIHQWKDRTAQELINNRILGNLYKIVGFEENSEKGAQLMHCLFVKGRIALVPQHLKFAINDFAKIKLINNFGVIYEFSPKDLIFTPIRTRMGQDKEAMLMHIDNKYLSNHPDITKHFQDSYEMGKWSTADVTVPVLRWFPKFGKMYPMFMGNTRAEALDNVMTIWDETRPEGEDTIILREGFTYNLNTINGDCGSPIICNEKGIIKKICGIHTAGDKNGKCFGESISSADLERALAFLPAKHQISLDLDSFNMPLNSTVSSYGKALKSLSESLVPCDAFNPLAPVENVPFEAGKTTLCPSLISGTLQEPIMKPAILKPCHIDGEFVDIKVKNLKKAAINTAIIDKEEVRKAALPVWKKLHKDIDPNLVKELTWEQAIKGDKTLSEFLEPINRSSSPGYPWVLERKNGTCGKQQWLGNDEWEISEDLMQACEYRLEQARKGIRVPTIWLDTLKDEKRPIAKVDAGKTRVFANGPQDFTIAFRKLFGGFLAHIMEHRITNEQSIGTNVWSQEWARTAKYLQKKGKKVVAGDFQTFDGTLNSSIFDGFVEGVNEAYGDAEGTPNAIARHVLFCEIINSIHLTSVFKEDEETLKLIVKYLIYIWTHSQPSGNPGTTPFNSYYNSVSVRLVYNRLTRFEGRQVVHFLHESRTDNFQGFAAQVFEHCLNKKEFKDAGSFVNKMKDGSVVHNIRSNNNNCWRKLTEWAMNHEGKFVAPELGCGLFGHTRKELDKCLAQIKARNPHIDICITSDLRFDLYKYHNRFDEFCTMVSYGDDNVINISDVIIDWFNQHTLTLGYATIGMIYTDEAKTGVEAPPYRLIHEVKYLKRQFIEDKETGLWRAPLDLEVVKEMTNWIRGDIDQEASTLENVSNAIRELSMHDESVFNELVPKLNHACLRVLKQLPEQLTYKGYADDRYIKYYI